MKININIWYEENGIQMEEDGMHFKEVLRNYQFVAKEDF